MGYHFNYIVADRILDILNNTTSIKTRVHKIISDEKLYNKTYNTFSNHFKDWFIKEDGVWVCKYLSISDSLPTTRPQSSNQDSSEENSDVFAKFNDIKNSMQNDNSIEESSVTDIENSQTSSNNFNKTHTLNPDDKQLTSFTKQLDSTPIADNATAKELIDSPSANDYFGDSQNEQGALFKINRLEKKIETLQKRITTLEKSSIDKDNIKNLVKSIVEVLKSFNDTL